MAKFVFLTIFIISVCIFLFHFLHVGTAVYGDGRYYYAYLPTFLIEHTFDFTNSFTHLGIPFLTGPTGLLQNQYAIGPTIVWTIPYLFFYVLLGLIVHTNQYSLVLQIPVGIWNISLVIIGLFLLYKSLKKFFSASISLLTVIVLFLTTNLFFYGSVDVINSHSSSFFFASLLTYLWFCKNNLKIALLMGLSLGMLILIRNQDAVFLLIPFTVLVLKRKRYVISFSITLATAFLLVIPQLLLWKIYWGGLFANPYTRGTAFNLLHPRLLEVLFNRQNGFFLWTPITILALFGLFHFTKKNKKYSITMLGIILAEIYIIASWAIWWEGASFSARMLVSTLPFLSFGLAEFFSLKKVFHYRYLLGILFSILNLLLIGIYLLLIK